MLLFGADARSDVQGSKQMKKSLLLGGAIAGVLVLATSASAQSIRVEFRDASGSQIGSPLSFASGEAIQLGTIENSVRRINIFSVGSGLANGGVVTLATLATRADEIQVFLGQGAIPADAEFELNDVVNNWGGLDVDADTQRWIRLSAGVAGNLTGPVFADTINRLQVGGTLGGLIDASATLGDISDVKFIVASSQGGCTTCDISTAGALGTLQFTQAFPAVTLSSDVLVGEAIENIAVEGGIGTIANHVTITASDGIGTIIAGEVRANITANAMNGQGDIESIVATDGIVSGTIVCDVLGSEVAAVSQPALISLGGTTTGLNLTCNSIFGDVQLPKAPSQSQANSTINVSGDWLFTSVIDINSSVFSTTIGGDLRLLVPNSNAYTDSCKYF
jgi:hypothetical protein